MAIQSSAPETRSYFQRLEYDAKLAGSVVAKYVSNFRLVLLLIISIAFLGFFSYFQLPKRLNPEVKIPIVTVITVLPGAGPSDVESLVTIPIEDRLRAVKGVDVVNSSSQNSVSAVTMQFFSTIDREKARADVQSAIDGVTDLPTDAQEPRVSLLDFEDVPVWTFAVISDKSYPDLMNLSNELTQVIENVSRVDRVQKTGFDTHEIVVELDPQKAAEYGINPVVLSSLIKRSRASIPAGNIETNQHTFSLTIDPVVESIDDIRNLSLSVQGKPIRLGDIATIAEQSKGNQSPAYVATKNSPPQQGVTFYVYKTVDSNIDDAGEEVQHAVQDFMKAKGEGYSIITFSNTSEEITEQFDDLLGEFRTTIVLVMGVILLFLGLRQALISSLTVPLTFLSAFLFMRITGMTINFISMFAFLLALGLLVDDTIVVVSAMTTYFKTGKFTPFQTGLLVWKDTIVPIWSTTITTIWSFLPLLITSGIIGEFIKPIPVVVTVTMLSSTAIAVLITLPLMIVLLRPLLPHRVLRLLQIVAFLIALGVIVALSIKSVLFPVILIIYVGFSFILSRTHTRVLQSVSKKWRTSIFTRTPWISRLFNRGLIDVDPFADKYRNLMRRILQKKSSRRNVLIAVVGYAICSFALLPLGFVKNEFFPKTDQDTLNVELKLPAGTTMEKTMQEGVAVLRQLTDTPQLEFVTAEIGRSGSNGFGGSSEAGGTVWYSLRLTDHELRSLSSIRIAEDLRTEFKDYTNGEISVIEASGGPPAGADIQIQLSGDDLSVLESQAQTVVSYLQTQTGLTNVKQSIQSGTSKIVFIPDLTKLSDYGISIESVGFSLRTFASGFTLDSVNFEKGESAKKDIVFRLGKGNLDAQDLGQLRIPSSTGQLIPLLELGRLESRPNPTSIVREDFKRTVTISAAVRPGTSVIEQNQKLLEFTNAIQLPAGYSWKTGGVNEENNKSMQSLLQAMVISAILIMITMVLQFGSFRQAAIVLIVIPLAVSSVFLVFALTAIPLTFPAMIGILSLFGIVVTNSMFIVDKINLNLREQMPFEEAIADAGASRLEPIILTKLCTVFGLLPITIADPLWRGLGGAIISGLLVASTIMLLFIPVLYYSWMKPTELKPIKRKKH